MSEYEKDSTKCFKRLSNDFADPLTEMHVSFFTAALPIFMNYNRFFQRNDPLPHKVLPMTNSLACKIAGRFILHDKLHSDIRINLIENEDNYVSLKDIFLGLMTKSKLNDFLENGDVSEVQYKKFIVGAIEFYQTINKVFVRKNVEALFWEHAVWVDFEEHANANWSDCEFFTLKFANVLALDEEKLELHYEQFHECKIIHNAELPNGVYEEALLSGTSNGHKKEYRVDVIWFYLQKMWSPVGPNYQFKLLFEVAQIVLTIPHSNTGIYHLFSLVNKNKNESTDRNRLVIEGSLSSILTVKLERPE